MRTQSRRIAFCGVLAGLAAALLALGGVIPAAAFAAPILSMIALLPVQEEYGLKTAATAYAAVSLLGLLLTADRETALVYLFFGWYPLLRPRVAALPSRLLRLAVRLAVCNAAILLLYGLIWRLLGLPEEAGGPLWTALLLMMGNLVFLLTDRVLERMTLLWRRRLRRRFFRV